MRGGSSAPRLAIVGSRGIPARYGGFETFAEQLAPRLVRRGIDVTVWCEKRGPQPGSFRGVRLRYAPAPRLGPLETLLYDFSSLHGARRDYDVVYMLGYTSAAVCAWSRIFGNQLWMNMDGLEYRRRKWPWYGRLFLRGMEASASRIPQRLIADSEAIRDHLRGRYRKLPPCDVIPYGTDVPEVAPSPESARARGLSPGGYYLIVARLEPENHLLEMIHAYRLAGVDRPLAIVGDHRRETRYVSQLRREEGGRIRFLGAIYDRDQLTALRWHARAYLHGHSVGGTNPSLLESMACGNAVLAHDNPFNREVAEDGAVYFRGPEELAAELRDFERDVAMRRELGEKGRLRARTAYRWDDVADRYESLLRSGRSS